MNTVERSDDATHAEGDWLDLQLQIARRADELAQRRRRIGGLRSDWDCWLEAEREVLGRCEPVLV